MMKVTRTNLTPEDWEVKKLNEVADFTRGFSYKGSEKSGIFGEFPFITLNSVNEGGGFKGEFSYISSSRLKERHFINKGQIFIANTEQTRTGTLLGSPALTQFPRGYAGNKGVFSHHITKVTVRPGVDKNFIYYYLIFIQKKAAQYNTGSVIWALDVENWSRQEDILLPPFPEQVAISSILMALDAKMAINEQMNIILEAIANAIFKHWFVDFEFPNEEAKPYKSSGGRFSDSILGKIPTGWEMTSLDQVAELTRGFSYKGFEKSKGGGEYLFVTLNSVKEGGGFKREFSFISSDRLKERHFVQSGDIVIANTEQTKTGTLLGYPALVEFPFGYKGDRAVISHHITKVVPKQPSLKYFLYYYLLFHQQKAVHYNTGSVIWALDVLNWAGQERVSIPPPKLIDSFNQLVDPIMRRFWENNLHTEILAGLRDAMLPKLISGKIRIQVEAS